MFNLKNILGLILFFVITINSSSSIDSFLEIKELLKKTYSEIEFRIDNSFLFKGEIYLPLIPNKERRNKKLDIVFLIIENKIPRLIWLSNDYAYVKVQSTDKNIRTILRKEEMPEQYKERFSKTQFPQDLIVPENFVIDKDLSALIGELPIKIKDTETNQKKSVQNISQIQSNISNVQDLKGFLYLTSPDSGKIAFLDLRNLFKINYIQTTGAPWEIAHDKKNNLLFITDVARDLIYKIKPLENVTLGNIQLASMSHPKDIVIPENDKAVYFIESVEGYLTIYLPSRENVFIKKDLPPNSSCFSLLNNLIAITNSTLNNLIILNSTDFSIEGSLDIEGGPEKIIASKKLNSFFITTRNNSKVIEIDATTKRIKKEIEVDKSPVSLALNPSESKLFVGCGKSNYIYVIDPITGIVNDKIELPLETEFPSDIEISNDGKWLIATSEVTNTISIINLEKNEVAATVDVGIKTHSAIIL